jgi:hypothetical protein
VRVAELGGFVVGLHHRELGFGDLRSGRANSRRRDREQQVVHGGVVLHRSDELPHHAKTAAAPDVARLRLVVTGDEPQEGRLARAVRADEGNLRSLADTKAHVIEQHPAVRQDMVNLDDVDVTHDR